MSEKSHENRKSFILYNDWEDFFKSLDSNEQAGQLINALFAFAKRGEIAEFSGALKMAFLFMSSQIERDSSKYIKKCEKNAEIARKRWERYHANECERKQTHANYTDTDTDTDTDTGMCINTHIGENTQTPFTPPSVEEVAAYCRERGNDIDAQRFIDNYTANGWTRGQQQIRDWKAVVRLWEKYPQYQQQSSQGKPARDSALENVSIDTELLEKLMNPY